MTEKLIELYTKDGNMDNVEGIQTFLPVSALFGHLLEDNMPDRLDTSDDWLLYRIAQMQSSMN
ncbi:hypothetical protein BGZ65_004067, partial [Modicella reniformis]